MMFFDQTDVVPILSASMLIFQMLSGLVIADEFNNYTGTELFGLFCGSLICIAGIQVLVMKKS